MSAATFFAAPSYGGDREPARPKAVNPVTGKEQSWTRASTFAADLKNPHGLIKSQGRNLVIGLSKRPDLLRMLMAGVPSDDRGKLDEIIEQALSVLAPEAKANEGTAAHAALSHAWLNPAEAVLDEFVPLVTAFASALREYGLTPLATEQRVLNLMYDSMGNLDWIFREANGAEVVGDVKTGDVQKAMLEFSVQLAMYAGARYVLDEKGAVSPIPWSLAQSHGVLIHVDLENDNAVSVYRVDLNIGRFGAGVAEQHRAFRTLKPLSPYVTPVVSAKVEASVVTINPGDSRQKLADAEIAVSPDGEVLKSRHLPLDEAQAVADVTSLPEAVAPAPEPVHPTDRYDELMKLDKAPLQQILKHTHNWPDLAHNRRWLARCIVALEQGADASQAKKYAAAKDEAPEVGGAGVPFEPTAPPKEPLAISPAEVDEVVAGQTGLGPGSSALLQAIAGASGMGALRALQADIVERHGDQAWTDELAEAVRLRSLEFAAQQREDALTESLRQIAACTTQQQLKELWERVTIGGSVPENWTPALAEEGRIRLNEIKAATPPPPANPFG